jgi:hypothetical protein
LLLLLQRDLNGHTYYEFEYTAKNSRYTRHSLAVVVANDGEEGGGEHAAGELPSPAKKYDACQLHADASV